METPVPKGVLSKPQKGGVICKLKFYFSLFLLFLLYMYCMKYLFDNIVSPVAATPILPGVFLTLFHVTLHSQANATLVPITLVATFFIRPTTPLGILTNSVTEILAHDDQHFLVFDQVGRMAASTTYLHVMLPLNLSTLHHQADLLRKELLPLTLLKTSNFTDLTLTKQLVDLGQSSIKRVSRAQAELHVLERILPQDTRTSRSGRLLPFIPILIATGLIALPITLLGAAIGISENRRANLEVQEQQRRAEFAAKSLKLTLAYSNYNATRQLVLNRIDESFKILPPQYNDVWDSSNFTIPDPPWESDDPEIQYSVVENHTLGLLDMIEGIDDQLYIFEILPHDRLPNPNKFRLPRDLPMEDSDRHALDYCNFLLQLQPLPDNVTDEDSLEQSYYDLKVSHDSYLSWDNLGNHRIRRKRFAEVAALVAGILSSASRVVGTFMGLYNSAEISSITRRVSSLEHTQDLLIHLSNRHAKYLVDLTHSLTHINRQLRSYLSLNPALLYVDINNHLVDYERRVSRMTGVLQQLQHRRLSVDWLDDAQLTALHNAVTQFADDRRMTLLTHHTSDYFQLELSYFRSGADVTAILHIPCIMAPTMLTIYRYVPFPIPLPAVTAHSPFSIKEALNPQRLHPDDATPNLSSEAQHPSTGEALYLVPDSDMIAISGDESFRLISQGDLAGCIQRNHVYLCESQYVLRTNLTETCLGSLYKKSVSGVRSNCRFDRRALQEKVYQLSGSTYLVYAPHPFTTRVDCINGSSFSAYFGQTTKLTIPSGCSVQLRSHFLRVDEKFHMPLPPEVTEWRWDPLSLPADLLGRASYLDSTFVDVLNNLTQLRSDAALDSEVPRIVDGHMPFHSWFGILIWCLTALASITPFGILGWYWYRRQRRLSRPSRYDLGDQYAFVLDPSRPLSLGTNSRRPLASQS